jgi:hypothetical protein
MANLYSAVNVHRFGWSDLGPISPSSVIPTPRSARVIVNVDLPVSRPTQIIE